MPRSEFSTPVSVPASAAFAPLDVPRMHAVLASGLAPGSAWADLAPWAAPLVTLPLKPPEVKAGLANLRSLDAEDLSASVHMAAAQYPRNPLVGTESKALDGFMARHGAGKTEGVPDEIVRHAQWQLLMVWVQEERVLEILELTRHCTRSALRLERLFGEEADAEASGVLAEALEPDAEALEEIRPLLPSWKFVLEYMSHFLPPHAVLRVNDPDMAAAVRTAGQAVESAECGTAQAFHVELSRLAPRFGGKDGAYVFVLPSSAEE